MVRNVLRGLAGKLTQHQCFSHCYVLTRESENWSPHLLLRKMLFHKATKAVLGTETELWQCYTDLQRRMLAVGMTVIHWLTKADAGCRHDSVTLTYKDRCLLQAWQCYTDIQRQMLAASMTVLHWHTKTDAGCKHDSVTLTYKDRCWLQAWQCYTDLKRQMLAVSMTVLHWLKKADAGCKYDSITDLQRQMLAVGMTVLQT